MTTPAPHSINIFYCYAHEDDALREQLARHLSPLRRLRYITGWFDRNIQAGADWVRESEANLDAANIILLLISADFFASDYCYTVEMKRALAKHRNGTACVIPILLRPVEWESTPIGKLSALPANKQPVTQWADQDKAWLNVVQGISEVIRKLLPMQQLSNEDADILYAEQGPLSGQTIGNKYLLGRLLGEGGFSEVYEAQHLQIRRQQAIKVLPERHFRKSEFRERFLREAQTVASLEHPHIIHLDDFWVELSRAYLVMPFMRKGTLQDILQKQKGFLKNDQIVSYLEQICSALDYAHAQGVVHLDLKPLNLLVHEDGRLLLSDFGLAHVMKQGAVEGGSSLRAGTPHYMAPEHIKGSPEKQSDIFSLGIILYQMLVGRLPFDGFSPETILVKNMTEWPEAPRALRPELPQAVEDVLGKALAKHPDQRYQTANEFLGAFKNAIGPMHNPRIELKAVLRRTEAEISLPWKLPESSLFNNPEEVKMQVLGDDTSTLAKTIQETLRSFRVDAEVRLEDISIGPTLIRFGIRPTGKPEMKLDEKTGKMVIVKDAAGNIIYEERTRVSRILALQNDLALVLEAKNIRMEAPVPGRPYVGVEIPKKNSRLVTLREVLESKEYLASKAKSKLSVALGKDVGGLVRIGDLARMPHLLIAGATGTGKSVFINTIIASILTQATPDDVRMLIVDPKMVELNMYNGIPHLLAPVVTEVDRVMPLLKNAITEMERRYRLFSQLDVRNLNEYRKLRLEKITKDDTSLNNLPAIVIIINELADLMMAAPEEIEGMICRLAQLARATGIHLVIATQHPSVDVITGLIKANIPTRISFMVSSSVDSRIIIDMGGAERLLGRGDMLYLPADAGRPERIQCSFLADKEVERLVLYWQQQIIDHARVVSEGDDPNTAPIHTAVKPGWKISDEPVVSDDFELDNDLLEKAKEVVRDYGRASISLLQRRLRIGYSRAVLLIDLLEEHGIIGPAESGQQGRKVL